MKTYLLNLLKLIIGLGNFFLLVYVGFGAVWFFWEENWPYNLIAICVCLLSLPLQGKLMEFIFGYNPINNKKAST